MRDVNSPAARTAAISLNVVCITYYNILPLVLGGAAAPPRRPFVERKSAGRRTGEEAISEAGLKRPV